MLTATVETLFQGASLASILLWAAAITAGRLLAYVGPTQPEAGIIFGSQ